jgi:hypothetical protein
VFLHIAIQNNKHHRTVNRKKYCRMWHTQPDFDYFADTLLFPPVRQL